MLLNHDLTEQVAKREQGDDYPHTFSCQYYKRLLQGLVTFHDLKGRYSFALILSKVSLFYIVITHGITYRVEYKKNFLSSLLIQLNLSFS